MPAIGSILFSSGYQYKVNDSLFVGLVSKNDKLEVRSCVITQFLMDDIAEIKIADIEEMVKVDPIILSHKKRHINRAIPFNFETNSFLTSI